MLPAGIGSPCTALAGLRLDRFALMPQKRKWVGQHRQANLEVDSKENSHSEERHFTDSRHPPRPSDYPKKIKPLRTKFLSFRLKSEKTLNVKKDLILSLSVR